MVFAKVLIFKGLCSLAACGGIGCMGFLYGEDVGKFINDVVNPKTLFEKGGLVCNGNGCRLKENRKLTIVHDGEVKGELTSNNLTSGNGKIKVYADHFNNYNENVKFTIESSDISFTAASGSSTSKLEELETYELKWFNGKYVLSRKTTTQKEIRDALGLPCDLSTTGTLTCSINTKEKLKAIKFEGKTSSNTNVEGFTTVTGNEEQLMIAKTDDTATFPLGYRFYFQKTDKEIKHKDIIFSGTSVVLPKNTDFKIKKRYSESHGTSLSLERAWSENISKLLEKVGLSGCTTDESICTIGNQGLNIKQGDEKVTEKTSSSTSPTGKMKLYIGKDRRYREDFKFVIEEGDIGIQDGNQITKLEELETYEIKEHEGTHYLTRMFNTKKTIKDSLKLPSACDFPDAVNQNTVCEINTEKLKGINFDGKSEGGTVTVTNNFNLKIYKEGDTATYPFGYKFDFETENNIDIPGSSGNITLKKDKHFKIKKIKGESLTLVANS